MKNRLKILNNTLYAQGRAKLTIIEITLSQMCTILIIRKVCAKNITLPFHNGPREILEPEVCD